VEPEAPDTVSWPSQASQPASLFPSRNRFIDGAEEIAHRFRLLSTSPPSSGFLSKRGDGFLLARHPNDAAPCNASPTEHAPMRPIDVCFPNSRLRAPVLAGSRCSPPSLRSERHDGLWGPPLGRGRRAITSPFHRFRRAAFTLVGWSGRAGRSSSPRDRCGRPLTRLSLLPLGFRWAVSTPSRGPSRARAAEDRCPPPRDWRAGTAIRGAPSADRGHFAEAKLSLRPGERALRAANRA